MNDRLLSFLRACDRDEYLDLAGRALVLAITRLAGPGGSMPPAITKSHAKGVTALQKVRGGYDVTRADLRCLAELEHALEHPGEVDLVASPEREALRAVLTSIGGSLPRATQARLARSVGGPEEGSQGDIPSKGLSLAGWYVVIVTMAFTLVAGASALPAAITFSGNAWTAALVPLAVVGLLIYVLYRRA